ncbi:MAG: hypothetical protein ACLFT4_10275, partial [Bacteroidales bacterium]
MLDNEKSYLYVDVGGGSTEITLFSNNQVVSSQSFNVGTIRMLKDRVDEEEHKRMKKYLKDIKVDYPNLRIIGSGGNINKIYKLAVKKNLKPLSYKKINEIYETLLPYSINERIKLFGLNPDRADVIIPAAKIFMEIMKWSDAKKILVPQFGVADGLVRQLYHNYKRQCC